jgi:hypothetical protein
VNQQQQDDLRECVKRGITLIDQHAPRDWRNSVNLGKLNMSSGVNCILGQLYGTFPNGLLALEFKMGERAYLSNDDDWQKICHNGFALDSTRPLTDCNILTNLWREEIGGANVGVPSVEHTPL